MRIAIVGSGISGLTAAYYLDKHHDVSVFEADDRIGGHTHTVDVNVLGKRYAIDTGFIVYNNRTYPQFTALLNGLHIASQPTVMGFSLRCMRSGLEYSGSGLNGLFAQRRNLLNWRFHRMLFDFFRFQNHAANFRKSGDTGSGDTGQTIGEYFANHPMSREFRDHYFLPMASAIWSCPRATIEEFPIDFVLQFYEHHGLLRLSDRPQWRVIRGGSRSYLDALTSGMKGHIHLNARIEALRRGEGQIELHVGGFWRTFDHVIVACHSDQALRILGSQATLLERQLLSAFPYESNAVTLHTDTSLLPRSRRAWTSWNYLIPADDPRKTTVTYNMNILQGIQAPETFCVTLNGDSWIEPRCILRRLRYDHPVFTIRRAEAQRRHGELIGYEGVSYCGAYWGNGFHEDGVCSALRVCDWFQAQASGPIPQAVHS